MKGCKPILIASDIDSWHSISKTLNLKTIIRDVRFERVIIAYTHALILDQIEVSGGKKYPLLVGCFVNTVHMPAWLHVSHNDVAIRVFPKGTISKNEGWAPFSM